MGNVSRLRCGPDPRFLYLSPAPAHWEAFVLPVSRCRWGRWGTWVRCANCKAGHGKNNASASCEVSAFRANCFPLSEPPPENSCGSADGVGFDAPKTEDLVNCTGNLTTVC